MQNTNIDNESEGVSSISDINVTPFIDVMLVLLIIFMVTAPLMMGGVKINLPKTSGMVLPKLETPLIVSLDLNHQIFVDKEPIAYEEREAIFKRLARESESAEVFIRGDGEVKYAKMMELMSELGQAGFARVTLITNVQPTSTNPTPTEPTAPTGAEAPMTSPLASPMASPMVTPTSSSAVTPRTTAPASPVATSASALPSSAAQSTSSPIEPAGAPSPSPPALTPTPAAEAASAL
jgi:biopolymer transport protein ExbD